jgi:hypothetical protein
MCDTIYAAFKLHDKELANNPTAFTNKTTTLDYFSRMQDLENIYPNFKVDEPKPYKTKYVEVKAINEEYSKGMDFEAQAQSHACFAKAKPFDCSSFKQGFMKFGINDLKLGEQKSFKAKDVEGKATNEKYSKEKDLEAQLPKDAKLNRRNISWLEYFKLYPPRLWVFLFSSMMLFACGLAVAVVWFAGPEYARGFLRYFLGGYMGGM